MTELRRILRTFLLGRRAHKNKAVLRMIKDRRCRIQLKITEGVYFNTTPWGCYELVRRPQSKWHADEECAVLLALLICFLVLHRAVASLPLDREVVRRSLPPRQHPHPHPHPLRHFSLNPFESPPSERAAGAFARVDPCVVWV